MLVLLPALCFLTYFIYRQTHPSPGQKRRILLVGLRSVIGSLLLLMLVEPVLSLWSKQVVRPLLLVLVDTSPSMTTAEGGTSRLRQVEEVLKHEDWRKALAQAEVRAWGFAENPYLLSLDTVSALQVNGQATDLSRALEKGLEQVFEQDNLQGIVLISDGVHNLGRDPVKTAEEAGKPVYTLLVGSKANPEDIQIVRVRAEETGYVGHAFDIEAEVRAWGYAGREVEVMLYDGEEEIARQRLTLQGDALIQRVTFAVKPRIPGPHIYRLFISPEKEELSRDNNEALVFSRVLEERIQVLLVAGGPSPDLAFLQRSLAADSSIATETLVQRRDGTFYQGEKRAEGIGEDKEVVVLLNAGVELLKGEVGRVLRRRVEDGAGLLFIGGGQSFRRWDPATPIAEVLPVSIEQPGNRFVDQETTLRPSVEGRHHPVVRLQAEVEEGEPWAQLPPLPGYFPITQKRRGAIVLVEGADQHRSPVIVAGAYGQGKVIAALSGAFWRLDLLSSGVGGNSQTIREFWRNAVKWLAIQTEVGRIRVSTEKHIYRAGEQVVFTAQVFDELLRPQDAATVQISLDEEEEVEFRLQEQGGGHYRGDWSGLEPGNYSYVARAYVGDAAIGEDEDSFIVEQHSIEAVEVRANDILLGEIARVSGGRLRPLSEWREILDILSLQKRLVEEKKVLPLWGPTWPLALTIMLLAVEWSIRKRGGMI